MIWQPWEAGAGQLHLLFLQMGANGVTVSLAQDTRCWEQIRCKHGSEEMVGRGDEKGAEPFDPLTWSPISPGMVSPS